MRTPRYSFIVLLSLMVLGCASPALTVNEAGALPDFRDGSPLHWLQLARASHEAGDWNSAIGYYQRALQLAPYMHEAHLGLGQSYYAAGRLRSAENALQDAADSANRVSLRTLYEAKLATLRREF